MLKTTDGTQTKRISKPGDRYPTTGIQRKRAVYTALGAETSINLASLTPAISYSPSQAQISVKRSSGGSLISGYDFFELTSSSIGFPPSDALVAGEIVEITQEVMITGVMAATPRPDCYTVTATTGQTLITADFSWPYNMNAGKGRGAVTLEVHGVGQTRYLDYTEVNLGGGNTNQLLLTDALLGGENITVTPTYQALDQTAAASTYNSQQLAGIQSGLTAGTQGWVDQATDLISVPNTTIINRAKIPNLANDLRASFGIERIPTQTIVQLQDEFGANGEPVWGVVNDDRGLIRCVGGNWASSVATVGPCITTNTIAGEYIEITFYGTGLNILLWMDTSSRNFPITLDGVAYSSLNYSSSTMIITRGYAANCVTTAVSGQSLGIHTVKIANNASVLGLYGFEILNATASNTSINVNSGTAYIGGKQYVNLLSDSIPYTSAGITNGKGGRVVRYLKADGTFDHVYTAIPSSPSYLTNANHTNEEVGRTHFPREFGVGRSDDFSLMSTTNVAGASFTLDDGTTTLVAVNARQGAVAFGIDVMATTGFLTFTFVGTGLDVYLACDGGARQITSIQIDGAASVGSISMLASTQGVYKICSGLPYGTHTVKFTTTYSTATPAFNKFIVYQPKTPSLPANGLEICAYNILADYNGTTATTSSFLGNNENPVGIINKINARELIYVGTWNMDMDVTTETRGGCRAFSSVSGDYFQYTFFGTGVNLHLSQFATAGGATLSITIDGSTAAGGVARVNITNNGSGNYTQAFGSSGFPCRVEFTGLSLGVHTIKVAKTNIYTSGVQSVDVITPIHSYKSNLYADLQNTLPIGSNSLMDSRKTSMIKEALPAQKAWAQSVGIASNVTTTSTVMVPIPDLSCTLKTNGSPIKLTLNMNIEGTTVGSYAIIQMFVDGAACTSKYAYPQVANSATMASDSFVLPVSAGVHKIDAYWSTNNASYTMKSVSTGRCLTVEEK
jgi:hypothetical protein